MCPYLQHELRSFVTLFLRMTPLSVRDRSLLLPFQPGQWASSLRDPYNTRRGTYHVPAIRNGFIRSLQGPCMFVGDGFHALPFCMVRKIIKGGHSDPPECFQTHRSGDKWRVTPAISVLLHKKSPNQTGCVLEDTY